MATDGYFTKVQFFTNLMSCTYVKNFPRYEHFYLQNFPSAYCLSDLRLGPLYSQPVPYSQRDHPVIMKGFFVEKCEGKA